MDLKGFKKIGSTSTHTIFEHPEGHVIHVAHKSLDGKKKNEMKNIPERKMADGGSVLDQMQQADRGQIPFIPDQPDESSAANPTDISNQGIPAQPQSPQQQIPAQRVYNGQPDPMSSQPGFDEAKNAIEMGAANAQDIGQASAELYRKQAQQEHIARQHFQKVTNQIQSDIDAMAQDVKNSQINPNHYMESMSAAKKVTTAIGLILGGMSSGTTGQENPAMKFLNNQIERDLASQKADLGKKENLLSALQKQYGNAIAAEDVFRVFRANDIANQIGELASNSKSAGAQPAKLQAMSELHKTYAPIAERAAALKVAGDIARSQQGPQEGQSAQLSNFLVPKDQQKEAAKELQIVHKTNEAHKAVDDLIDNAMKEQTLGNRVLSPIQSAQRIKALKAQLIPLMLEASPSKRLTHEVLESEIAPLLPGLTTNKESAETFRKQMHDIVNMHADSPTLLEQHQVPYPKYKGKEQPTTAMDKLGQKFELNKATGKYVRKH